jgi:hypothetical protein
MRQNQFGRYACYLYQPCYLPIYVSIIIINAMHLLALFASILPAARCVS